MWLRLQAFVVLPLSLLTRLRKAVTHQIQVLLLHLQSDHPQSVITIMNALNPPPAAVSLKSVTPAMNGVAVHWKVPHAVRIITVAAHMITLFVMCMPALVPW